MKKYQHELLSLANKFQKYANVDAASIKDKITQAVQTAIANASRSPANSGIMNFLEMLKQDGSGLNINVTRDGNNFSVSPPRLADGIDASKYQPLSGQIQKYLERYPQVYPTVLNGESVDYNQLEITLQYPAPGVV